MATRTRSRPAVDAAARFADVEFLLLQSLLHQSSVPGDVETEPDFRRYFKHFRELGIVRSRARRRDDGTWTTVLVVPPLARKLAEARLSELERLAGKRVATT